MNADATPRGPVPPLSLEHHLGPEELQTLLADVGLQGLAPSGQMTISPVGLLHRGSGPLGLDSYVVRWIGIPLPALPPAPTRCVRYTSPDCTESILLVHCVQLVPIADPTVWGEVRWPTERSKEILIRCRGGDATAKRVGRIHAALGRLLIYARGPGRRPFLENPPTGCPELVDSAIEEKRRAPKLRWRDLAQARGLTEETLREWRNWRKTEFAERGRA